MGSALTAEAPGGIAAVDKPAGWTSHDVVAVMRRVLGTKRVGHGGTLDPLATGVLPILAGPATKWLERLHTAPKVYAAVVAFGSETTTDDREGPPRRVADAPLVSEGELDAALARFRGDIEQVPPDRSAVQVGGRRAYAIARAGEEVRLAARVVRIERLAIASWAPPRSRLLIVCGSGTYVRSLARDIGRALGSAAHLAALRRLAVGGLEAASALELGRLRATPTGEATRLLRPPDDRLLRLDERFRSTPASELLAGWEVA